MLWFHARRQPVTTVEDVVITHATSGLMRKIEKLDEEVRSIRKRITEMGEGKS